MDSSILGSKGPSPSFQQISFPKKESNSDAATPPTPAVEAQVGAAMTIPQLHQAQEQAVKELQKAIEAIQGPQKTLQISMHEQTHAIMIKVLNKETGDLIREVPSEKILDVVAKMMQITGILVDKKI